MFNLAETFKLIDVPIATSFMSFMEVFYITLQERDIDEAKIRLNLMGSLPITRVESTEPLGLIASKLKAGYRLSVADAWIAALAEEKGSILVHKDPEFEQLEDTLSVQKLPYK
jgi:predicted nucleic acid-binding protein